MDTWIVHFINASGTPRIVVTEVQAATVEDAVIHACTQAGKAPTDVISVRLKAPFVMD